MKLKNKFIIVVPVYNQPKLIAECIESILSQEFDDIGIIIRDDCSTDGTYDVAFELLKNRSLTWYTTLEEGIHFHSELKKSVDVILIKNSKKLYPCGNIYESVRDYVDNDEAIIGTVDGDDRLISNRALQIMYDEYQKGNIWLAWSQHVDSQGTTGCSLPLVPDAQIYSNRYYWCMSHFRTAKAWLYKRLDPTGLIDFFDKASYIKNCGDAAILFPMIEMSGNEHAKFVDTVLYMYNNATGLNEHRPDNVGLQHRYSHLIKFLPMYQKITK